MFKRIVSQLSIIAMFAVILSVGVLATAKPAHATSIHISPSVSSVVTDTHKVVTNVVQVNGGSGCPSGYVCIYPQDAGWNGGHPSNTYYNYGTYNLYNQYGNHVVYNNQYLDNGSGHGMLELCFGWNGQNCLSFLTPGESEEVDLTPINSIILF